MESRDNLLKRIQKIQSKQKRNQIREQVIDNEVYCKHFSVSDVFLRQNHLLNYHGSSMPWIMIALPKNGSFKDKSTEHFHNLVGRRYSIYIKSNTNTFSVVHAYAKQLITSPVYWLSSLDISTITCWLSQHDFTNEYNLYPIQFSTALKKFAQHLNYY